MLLSGGRDAGGGGGGSQFGGSLDPHTMEQKQQVQNAFSFLFLGALILEFKSS